MGKVDDMSAAYGYFSSILPLHVDDSGVVPGISKTLSALLGAHNVINVISGERDFDWNTVQSAANVGEGVSSGVAYFFGTTEAGTVSAGATFASLSAWCFAGISLVATQFALMGAGKSAAAREQKARAEDFGQRLGFAAGATGAGLPYVKKIAEPFEQIPSPRYEERVFRRYFVDSLYDGWRQASELSDSQKQDYQRCILEKAAELGKHIETYPDQAYDALVHMMAATARVAEGVCTVSEDEIIAELNAPTGEKVTDSVPDERDEGAGEFAAVSIPDGDAGDSGDVSATSEASGDRVPDSTVLPEAENAAAKAGTPHVASETDELVETSLKGNVGHIQDDELSEVGVSEPEPDEREEDAEDEVDRDFKQEPESEPEPEPDR